MTEFTGATELLKTGAALKRKTGVPLRACTFDRHPMAVFRPEQAPPLLTNIPRKAFLMGRSGADEMQVIPFTRKLADRSPEEFLHRMRENVQVKAVIAGWNYTFGKGGEGTADTLVEDGKAHSYQVIILPPYTDQNGTVISSTGIREMLASGRIREACNCLGSPYVLSGRIREDGNCRLWVEQTGKNGGIMVPADGTYLCDLLLHDGGLIRRIPVPVEGGTVFVPLSWKPESHADRIQISFRERIR